MVLGWPFCLGRLFFNFLNFPCGGESYCRGGCRIARGREIGESSIREYRVYNVSQETLG